GHHPDIPIDPGDAHPVVPDGPDGPGDVGAVVVVVHRVAVVGHEVVPVDVVDETVAVVVLAVPGDLTRVGPDVGGEVRVGVVDAGVEDGDQGAGRPGRLVPGFRRVDVRVRGAARLAGVVEAPKVPKGRVVGHPVDAQPVVRLGVEDVRIGPV